MQSAVLLLVSASFAAGGGMKTEYVIGGWIAGTPEMLLAQWRPIFETYLTETVGSKHDPPFTFTLRPINLDENTTAEQLTKTTQIDFLYDTAASTACAAATSGFAPIATQHRSTPALGSVVYSRKDGPVRNISDIRGKRVGIGQASPCISTHLRASPWISAH